MLQLWWTQRWNSKIRHYLKTYSNYWIACFKLCLPTLLLLILLKIKFHSSLFAYYKRKLKKRKKIFSNTKMEKIVKSKEILFAFYSCLLSLNLFFIVWCQKRENGHKLDSVLQDNIVIFLQKGIMDAFKAE